MQQLFVFGPKRPGRVDHEIGPDQIARLIIDRARQAVAKRADAYQCRNPKRDRNRKQQEPSPARPAVAPRHFPDEGAAHTISPLRRRIVRSVRPATSGSCVTKTSAVPALRFNSSITSMTDPLVS